MADRNLRTLVTVLAGLLVVVVAVTLLVIVGRNGAGKSTLLKALVGILRVTSGRVHLEDQDVTNHQPEDLARRGVGYVPQVEDIFEPLTVYENLEMGGYLLRPAQIRSRADEVGRRLPRARTHAETSCGQAQRRRAQDAGDRPAC